MGYSLRLSREQVNKLKNRKVVFEGKTFDSQKEARRYAELLMLERGGAISKLRTQVEFVLIPSQKIDGKVVERAVKYIADFVYIDNETGLEVVEDVKGYRDPSSAPYAKFVLKRKMMLYLRGIRVIEV
jgi:hypothetical protein